MKLTKIPVLISILQTNLYAAENDTKALNQLIALQAAKITALENSMKGLIGQFANACPAGWLPADGRDGRPDLRGVFLRGVNDFGTGSRSDGYADPENRTAGSVQGQAFQSHSHAISDAGSHSHSLSPAGHHAHGIRGSGDHAHRTAGSAYVHGAHGGVNKLPLWTSAGTAASQAAGHHSHDMDAAGNHSHDVGASENHSHSAAASGGVGTRPNNVAVTFCVKS